MSGYWKAPERIAPKATAIIRSAFDASELDIQDINHGVLNTASDWIESVIDGGLKPLVDFGKDDNGNDEIIITADGTEVYRHAI